MADNHTYKFINYTLAPSGLYVGWTYYENGIYYASHRTIDKMIYGVKHQLYLAKRVSYRGYNVALSPTPKEEVPIDKMKQAFLTRAYWGQKTVQKLTKEQMEYNKKIGLLDKKEEPKAEPVEEPKVEYDYYDYQIEDGKLVVFGCKKVAEYAIKPDGIMAKDTQPTDEPKGTLHLPLTTD